MGLFILLLFIGVPILEIAVFIGVGERIGLFNTIAIVILTAVAGTALLRSQGLSVLGRAQESLRENRFPMEEVFDGLCLVLAGALLLTPGFVTDMFGFLLFFPPARLALKKIGTRFISSRAHVHSSSSSPGKRRSTSDIIDGEFVDVTDPLKPTPEIEGEVENRDQTPKP